MYDEDFKGLHDQMLRYCECLRVIGEKLPSDSEEHDAIVNAALALQFSITRHPHEFDGFRRRLGEKLTDVEEQQLKRMGIDPKKSSED